MVHYSNKHSTLIKLYTHAHIIHIIHITSDTGTYIINTNTNNDNKQGIKQFAPWNSVTNGVQKLNFFRKYYLFNNQSAIMTFSIFVICLLIHVSCKMNYLLLDQKKIYKKLSFLFFLPFWMCMSKDYQIY